MRLKTAKTQSNSGRAGWGPAACVRPEPPGGFPEATGGGGLYPQWSHILCQGRDCGWGRASWVPARCSTPGSGTFLCVGSGAVERLVAGAAMGRQDWDLVEVGSTRLGREGPGTRVQSRTAGLLQSRMRLRLLVAVLCTGILAGAPQARAQRRERGGHGGGPQQDTALCPDPVPPDSLVPQPSGTRIGSP